MAVIVTTSRPPGIAHGWEKDLTALWLNASSAEECASVPAPMAASANANSREITLSNSVPLSCKSGLPRRPVASACEVEPDYPYGLLFGYEISEVIGDGRNRLFPVNHLIVVDIVL